MNTRFIELVLSSFVVLSSYAFPLYLNGSYDKGNFTSFYYLSAFILILSFFVFVVVEYTDSTNVSKSRNILKVFISSIFIAFLLMAIAFFFRSFSFPRSLIVYGFILQFFSLSVVRIFFRNKLRNKIFNKTLLISTQTDCQNFFDTVYGYKLPNEKIIASLIVDKDGYSISKITTEFNKVFISDKALKYISDYELNMLVAKNIEMVIVPRKYEISIWGAKPLSFDNNIALGSMPLGISFEGRLFKRAFDIVFSIFALLLTFPIQILVALAIYLEDKQNPIFIQERVTFDNKVFKLIKFRSMRVNAESGSNAVWAENNDPRITKVGKIIRKLWLDELPQFINVFKGDMSVVGPRPERQVLINEFSKNIPEFKYRTSVKAGITGYAQCLTNYDTLPENKLKFDLIYIRKWSALFDILIIIETVRKIVVKAFDIFSKEKVPKKAKCKTDKNYIEYIYEK